MATQNRQMGMNYRPSNVTTSDSINIASQLKNLEAQVARLSCQNINNSYLGFNQKKSQDVHFQEEANWVDHQSYSRWNEQNRFDNRVQNQQFPHR